MKELSVIAKRLREARLKAKLSQKSLGITAGIDEFSASARINQYERGKHVPDIFTAILLADVLGVPLPFFYAEDDLLAEMILKFTELNSQEKEQIINRLEQPD